MKRYQLKLVFRGVSPMIWRRLFIPEQTSLEVLHQAIQIMYHWDNDYLYQFHIYGQDYGRSHAGVAPLTSTLRRILIDDFEFDIGDKFTYQYNFFENHIIDIRIENIEESENTTVHCVKGNNMPLSKTYNEKSSIINLIKSVRHADKEELRQKVSHFLDDLHAVRFERDYINNRFQTEIIA